MTTPPGEPAVGQAGGVTGADMPSAMTIAEMDAAFDAGRAVPLGHAITWLAKHQGRWWVLWERGWLLIDDEAASAELDEIAEDLAQTGGAAREAALAEALGPELFKPPSGPAIRRKDNEHASDVSDNHAP